MIYRILEPLLFFLSGFMPRNPKKIVFGAWMGRRYADNPKYLLEYLTRMSVPLDLVWIADASVAATLPRDIPIRFAPRGSIRAAWEMLTAGTCFVTHCMDDLGRFNLMRGACRVNLGHGLAIKRMGSTDRPLRSKVLTAVRHLVRQTYRFDHYIACSDAHRAKLLIENATNNIEPSQLLPCGQPRVDFLLRKAEPQFISALRARMLSGAAVAEGTRFITYLPTFRDKGHPTFSFAALEGSRRDEFDRMLARHNAMLLEKTHFAERHGSDSSGHSAPRRVLCLSGSDTDTQELLLATDLLITDYSGCYVDFLVLDRPVLHFAYDRAYYETADRGLYFDLDKVAGGAITPDFESLCARIDTILAGSDPDRLQRHRAKAALTEYECGTACRQIARDVLRREEARSSMVAPVRQYSRSR